MKRQTFDFKTVLAFYVLDAIYHLLIQFSFNGFTDTITWVSVLARSVGMVIIALIFFSILKLRSLYFNDANFFVIYFFLFVLGYILIPIIASILLYHENFTTELLWKAHTSLLGYFILYGSYWLAFLTSIVLQSKYKYFAA